MSSTYQKTLDVARKLAGRRGQYIVANVDHEKFGCNATTLNNRLAVLEKHGKMFSEVHGRQRRFYLCTTKG